MGIMDAWGAPEDYGNRRAKRAYVLPRRHLKPSPQDAKKPAVKATVKPAISQPVPVVDQSKIRDDLVREMRNLGHSQSAIAARLGVTPKEFARLYPQIKGLDRAQEE